MKKGFLKRFLVVSAILAVVVLLLNPIFDKLHSYTIHDKEYWVIYDFEHPIEWAESNWGHQQSLDDLKKAVDKTYGPAPTPLPNK